tara:strand:- start:651 stop:1466 length:816 start_codon:yes stop_codon:yes gene_type:complete
MSRRQGVLSDQYIKDKCYNQFMPISTGKLDAVMKPKSGSLLTSIRPPEETPQVNFVPYFTSVNQVQDSNGAERIKQRTAAGESIMNKVKTAKENYTRLAGTEQRRAVLVQDVGIKNIREAQKIVSNKVKSATVELSEDDSNNPFNPLVQQSIAQRLINKYSTPVKEESSMALSGAVRQIENIKNPDLGSEGLVTVLATTKDTSSLFVNKRQQTQGRGQPGGEGSVLPADFNKETLPGTLTSGPRPGLKMVPGASDPVMGQKIPPSTSMMGR